MQVITNNDNYILTHADGSRSVMSKAEFEKLYEEVKE